MAKNSFVAELTFKKRANHLVTYKSDPSKTQVDYCLVRKNQRKFLNDISLN